jgi:hypothetical protein
MAADNGVQMDQKAHEQTYNGFITALKISTAITVITTAIIIILIAN